MWPRLLHIYGSLWIQSYGVMIVLGFLIFMFFAYKDKRRAKIIESETFFNAIFLGLIGAIVGGRLWFVVEAWQYFKSVPIEIFFIWHGSHHQF